MVRYQFIIDCGELLNHLCTIFTSSSSDVYPLLVRLLAEQYEIITEQKAPKSEASDEDLPNPPVQLKDRKEINGSTLQSPHDADAAYRKKENGGSIQEVQGYTTNIGETCHADNPFNLITTATTAPVTTQDNDFVESSIEQSQRVGGMIDTSWMDGAYSSAINRNWLSELGITAYFPALAGYKGFHHFEWVENPDFPNQQQLIVTDLRDAKQYIAQLTRNGKKYKITYEKPDKEGGASYRYFTFQEIENYFKRQQIEALPKEILNRRANIEATIHQVFCKLGKKSKYRGKFANHLMVLARCFWVNCTRITQNKVKNAFISLFFQPFAQQYLRVQQFHGKFGYCYIAFLLKLPNLIRLCQ